MNMPGAGNDRSANAARTLSPMVFRSSWGTSAIADPPKPPPVILAPSAPAAHAASTAMSSSRQDTR